MAAFGFRPCVQMLCLAAVLSLHAAPVVAFGVKTHGWLANEVLKDISDDCRLTVSGRHYRLSDEQCFSIRNYPGYFLEGALAPDIYPDMVASQVITHPLSSAAWQSGDWLRHVVNSADSGPALAFASGYLVHAAQDIFANSYSNTFAGGAFSLQSDPEVAARHMAVEQYLDAHLPSAGPDAAGLGVPAAFLKSALLFNADAVAQYRLTGAAPHIVALNDVKTAVEDMTFDIEALEDMSRELLASYLAEEPSWATRQELEQKLAPQLRQHEIVLQKLSASIAALEDNERVLASLRANRSTEVAAIAAAENIYIEASDAHRELDRALLELQEKSSREPKNIAEESCRNVKKWINAREWTSNRVCQQKNTSNRALSEIRAAISRVRQDIAEEEKFSADAVVAKSAAAARLDVIAANIRQAELRQEKLGAERTAAEAAYQRSVLALQAEPLPDLLANESSDVQPPYLQPLIAEREKMLQTLQRLLGDLHELSFTGRNWQAAIDRAGDEYVYAGLRTSQLLLTDKGGTVEEYRAWLSCPGAAFLMQPYVHDEKGCVAETPYQHTMKVLQQVETALHAPGLSVLDDAYQPIKKTSLANLQQAVEASTDSLADFVAPEGALSWLAGMREDASYSRRRSVQVLLAEAGQAGDIPLLTWTNGADIIDADAGMSASAGTWRPDVFLAAQYAGRLSRMALLSGADLNRLSGSLAGRHFSRWHLFPEDETRYSFLYATLRDMSGNQQWQSFGLPYARSEGDAEPQDPDKRQYGFANGDARGTGFVIFSNPEARKKVFMQLFPASLSLVESDPRMQAPHYAFPSCPENPFPVTFTASGTAAVSDPACTRHEVVRQ